MGLYMVNHCLYLLIVLTRLHAVASMGDLGLAASGTNNSPRNSSQTFLSSRKSISRSESNISSTPPMLPTTTAVPERKAGRFTNTVPTSETLSASINALQTSSSRLHKLYTASYNPLEASSTSLAASQTPFSSIVNSPSILKVHTSATSQRSFIRPTNSTSGLKNTGAPHNIFLQETKSGLIASASPEQQNWTNQLDKYRAEHAQCLAFNTSQAGGNPPGGTNFKPVSLGPDGQPQGNSGACTILYPSVQVSYFQDGNSTNTWCLQWRSSSQVLSGMTQTPIVQPNPRGVLRRDDNQILSPAASPLRPLSSPAITPGPILPTQVSSGMLDQGRLGHILIGDATGHDFSYTSPSVYLVFETISAIDDCGNSVGGTYTSITAAYAENELQSIEPFSSQTLPYNFQDLPCPRKYTPQPGLSSA